MTIRVHLTSCRSAWPYSQSTLVSSPWPFLWRFLPRWSGWRTRVLRVVSRCTPLPLWGMHPPATRTGWCFSTGSFQAGWWRGWSRGGGSAIRGSHVRSSTPRGAGTPWWPWTLPSPSASPASTVRTRRLSIPAVMEWHLLICLLGMGRIFCTTLLRKSQMRI